MDIEEFFGEQFHQWRERFRYYEMAITELESDLGIIDLDWQTRLGYSPIEHVKTRMKTLPSIVRKMNQKQLPLEVEALWDNIYDVAGVRIVTSFRDDIYAILEHLKNRDDMQIITVKDYIKHPKPSGYRSLHLIVRTKVYLAERVIWVPAEIQIRTLAMDFWAATEHKLQYKYQQDVPESSKQELVEAARLADTLDTQMGRIRQQILKQ